MKKRIQPFSLIVVWSQKRSFFLFQKGLPNKDQLIMLMEIDLENPIGIFCFENFCCCWFFSWASSVETVEMSFYLKFWEKRTETLLKLNHLFAPVASNSMTLVAEKPTCSMMHLSVSFLFTLFLQIIIQCSMLQLMASR